MTSDKLHEWLQVFGAASIVASLIFVGLQLKQSQEIAIAAQYQARYDSALAELNAIIESDSALRVAGKQAQMYVETNPNSSEELKNWVKGQSVEELGVQWTQTYLRLKSFDNLYFQYQSGYLDDDSWQAFRQEYIVTLDPPNAVLDMRMWYENTRSNWRAPFREMVDEVIAEIDAKRTDSKLE